VQNISHEHSPFLNTFVQKILETSEYKEISAWARAFFYSISILLMF